MADTKSKGAVCVGSSIYQCTHWHCSGHQLPLFPLHPLCNSFYPAAGYIFAGINFGHNQEVFPQLQCRLFGTSIQPSIPKFALF